MIRPDAKLPKASEIKIQRIRSLLRGGDFVSPFAQKIRPRDKAAFVFDIRRGENSAVIRTSVRFGDDGSPIKGEQILKTLCSVQADISPDSTRELDFWEPVGEQVPLPAESVVSGRFGRFKITAIQ